MNDLFWPAYFNPQTFWTQNFWPLPTAGGATPEYKVYKKIVAGPWR